MKAKVTNEGVQIPKSLLEGIKEVEIKKENGLILVLPLTEDSTLKLDSQAVKDEAEDAAENHNQYILSLRGLANAYSDSEPEYSLDLIKEPNPEYERR
ncbi:MAG: hypothetical protein H7Z38_08715 [Rubrivivax sp.]|nr:hypothetical protein [Pyrinomonadaceae bacterium]